MRRKGATIYAMLCTLLLAAGFVLVFFFAWKAGSREMGECIVGVVLGFSISPIVHELGHILCAEAAKMRIVYTKFFCFRVFIKDGKTRFGFASPFAADQTQVIPKVGGNMRKRALHYTRGGLLLSLALLFLALSASLACVYLGNTSYILWGFVPYAAYLFALNALPLEYASGKTDMLVYKGIKRGFDAEKTMLAAMEIQGRLYAGESYAEIEESWYYDLPQLCENEPLYAVILDLRYRYHLEKEEMEKAADCLNRLAISQAYLSDEELEKIAAELTYMHALNGDIERAEESAKLCRGYLQSNQASAKRILATYAATVGQKDGVKTLIEQAKCALEKEWIAGNKKFEEKLISRIAGV